MDEKSKNQQIDYAPPPEREGRMPSPWRFATLAGNPIVVVAVGVLLTLLVIVIRVTLQVIRQ